MRPECEIVWFKPFLHWPRVGLHTMDGETRDGKTKQKTIAQQEMMFASFLTLEVNKDLV